MTKRLVLRLVLYGWAAIAVVVALGVRLLLHPLLGDNRPFLTFLAAVAVAASIGGRGPAIFAIVVSYFVANFFLIPPLGSFYFNHASANDWANVLVFIALALLISEPIVAMQRARRRAESYAAEVVQLLAAATEADRQKDQFLAILAHELRNPLTPLTNALLLWPLMADKPAEMGRLRDVISRQVRVVIRLVDDLMDAARYARGAIRLQKERIDVAALIGQTIESIQPKIEARGHQLHVALADEPLFVNGDVVRLHQIFLNILDNAIKYTGRDGTIWISAVRLRNGAVVRIRDNGPGISAAMLPTVFEMFSQAGTTLDRSAGGLGIGLYLVKQLVELHNGTIEARSDGPGEGSEFMVTLPALAACAPSAGIEQQPQFAGELAPQIAHS